MTKQLRKFTSNLAEITQILGMYHSLKYVIFMSCNLRPLCRVISYCNVGWCIKGSAVHHCRQQCLIAEWLGLGPWNGILFHFFFLSVLKVTNTFVLHVNGSCGVHDLRTTTVCDVMMMYCTEWYMENVPDTP